MKTKHIIPFVILLSTVSCNHEDPSPGATPPPCAESWGIVLESSAQSITITRDTYIFVWWENNMQLYDATGKQPLSHQSPDKIEYKWLTVEKPAGPEAREITISVQENSTGDPREIMIDFDGPSGCGNILQVTQKAAAVE